MSSVGNVVSLWGKENNKARVRRAGSKDAPAFGLARHPFSRDSSINFYTRAIHLDNLPSNVPQPTHLP